MKLLSIKPSTKADKKYMATFEGDSGRTKTVHFGAAGAEDYTMHKDPERKQRYLDRHKARESWNKADTPGALSRWILWNKPSFQESVRDYKARFNFS